MLPSGKKNKGMYREAAIITFSVVFILDEALVVEGLKYYIWKKLNGKGLPYAGLSWKPLDCSLCLAFWAVALNTFIKTQDFYTTLGLATAAGFTTIIIKKILNKWN